MFKKFFDFTKKHKFLSVLIALVLIIGGYYAYKSLTTKAGETKYVLAAVEKGSVITTISGTGQVSASNQVDIKPKVSGSVVYVGVKQGQEVKTGTLIMQVDATDAQKSVRDAQINLDSAKISLQKIQQPADALSVLQSENSLTQAQQAKIKATDDLKKAYDDAFTDISNAFLDLPSLVTGISDILYKNTYSISQDNISYYSDQVRDFDYGVFAYRDSTNAAYQTARAAYDKNFIDYKATTRYAAPDDIEALLNETYDTAIATADSIKSSDNFLSFVKDLLTTHNKNLPASLAAHQSSIATYTGKINGHIQNLLNSKTSIKNAIDTIANTDVDIKVKTESLNNLQAGTDVLDIKSSQLSVTQRQNSLSDARAKLADYFIRAPFDGVIVQFDFKKNDSVGSSDVVAILTTQQKMAEISLNEVDVAKVKVGQKATLTFDAVPDLSITGEVAQIDAIGAVSQGVVTYNVKIGFDTQDDRIKSGMSVSTNIITEIKQDVLSVPNSAIKSQGGVYYVEMLDNPSSTSTSNQGVTSPMPPRQQIVQTGISNDTVTEIISGLNEGDQIITKTIAPTAAKAATQSAPSIFGAVGGNSRGAVGGATSGAGAARALR